MAELQPTCRFSALQDLTGLRFARLTVQSFAGTRKGKRYWNCQCECGGSCVVTTTHLNTGNTKSCGCLEREALRQRSTKHGAKGTPEYRAWEHIIKRCCNPNVICYRNYGGRGIKVCAAWRHDFASFLAHIGPKPSSEYSIDRIDNNGDYEPGNVRWAKRTTQARNTRANRMIEFRGERRCLTEWAEILGINLYTLHGRLNKRGWDVERAFTVQPISGGNY